jgi:hypothetical protein
MMGNSGYVIEAVVKFNDGEALVLSEHPDITYENHFPYLFGVDQYGVFVNVYKYDAPSPGFQAFAGREFDIPMTDGTVTKAVGQWWDGGGDALGQALGSEIIRVTVNTKRDLENCYVFYGLRADEKEYQKLRDSYTGKVYGYWEYEAIIKNLDRPRRLDGES